jgi:hypothetical protein
MSSPSPPVLAQLSGASALRLGACPAWRHALVSRLALNAAAVLAGARSLIAIGE